MQALVEDDDGEVGSAPTARSAVGRRGASRRLLRKARLLLDPDEVLELALGGDRILADDAPVEAIRARARTLGPGAAEPILAVWRHVYEGGPLPITYAGQADEWRAWFEAEGLAPHPRQGLHAEPAARTDPPMIDGRSPFPHVPEPSQKDSWPTETDQRVADLQVAQQQAVEAWRAQQLASLRALWTDGFHEGVRNFAEQYPEMADEELLAELDAEEANDEAMGPHFASVGKMFGELTNLLMLAPVVAQITQWFDQNEHRVRQQAETMAWQAEQRGYRQAGANQGMTIVWESEGDDRVCDDCLALEAAGPYTDEGGDNPLPAFPGDGSTQCGPNCRCSLNYLEPDQPGLAEAGIDEEGSSPSDAGLSSEPLLQALDVAQMSELEGGSMATTLDHVATSTRHLDVEAGFALDEQGNIIAAALGNADSLDFTQAQLQAQRGAALVVHNHPLSTSFSPSDVAFAYSQAVGEMRVLSPEWDYSLRPALGKRFLPLEGSLVINAAQARVDELYPLVKERATLAYQKQLEVAGAKHETYAEVFRRESADFWHDVWAGTAKDTGLIRYERTPAPKLAQMVHVQPAHVGGLPGLEAGKTPLPFGAWLDDLRARYQIELEMSRRDLDGKNDLWTLSKIVVPKAGRGAGAGSAAMREITARADQVGATLALTPSSAFGGSVGRLRTFYARFGFERNVGPSRDLRISEALVRAPRGGATFPSLQEAKAKVLGQMPLTFPTKEASLLDMEKVGGPAGSNEGWWLHDKKFDLDYYVKPMDAAHAANEVGAMRVYEAMGAVPGKDIPYVGIVQRAGDKPVVVSRSVQVLASRPSTWWEGKSVGAETARLDARRFWATDALLSHYDVVGLANDNLLLRDETAAFRVEGGGAMRYRAQGALKNEWKVGAHWTEPWTMRGIAKDGVVPMATVKPVFGTIGNQQASELLGKLKALDTDAVMQSWKDLGMNADERIHNMAVIKSRLTQIPTIQEQLGFKAAVPVPVEAKPVAAVASKVQYAPWNPKGDLWGNNLSVQLKPIFLDWKKEFAPVAGVASHVVESYAVGVELPVYKKTSATYMKVRLAFAKSYNEALAGQAAASPAVKEFWAKHLGLVETKSVDVQHVVSTWLPKPKDEAPVKAIATALPKWDQEHDALGIAFREAHPDWYAALEKAPASVQNAVVEFGKGSYSRGFALTYNDYLHGSPILKAGAAPEVQAFWAKLLGDLPAQPEKVELAAPAAAKAQAVEAAKAGPYDELFANAKDSISTGQDHDDVLVWLGEKFEQLGVGDPAVQDEFMSGLVKFGLAGDAESAANQVADWMATFGQDETPKLAPAGTLDHDALIAKLQAVGYNASNEEVYVGWYDYLYKGSGKLPEYVAGKGSSQIEEQKAIWTKWLQDKGIAPAVEKGPVWLKPDADAFAQFEADKVEGVGATSLKMFASTYDDWVAGGDQASWMPTPVTKWFDANMVKPGAATSYEALEADWAKQFGTAPFDDWYKSWTTGEPLQGVEGAIKPDSPGGKFFVQHGVPQGETFFKPGPPGPETLFGEQWQEALAKSSQPDDLGVIWNHIYNGGPPLLGKASGVPLKPATVAKWKTWFENNGLAPEYALTKEEQAVAAAQLPEASVPQSTMTFAPQTTLLAWSPSSDKWASKFGKAHPKLYGSFSKEFKGATWVDDLTKDLQFPASVLAPETKTGVKESSIAWYKTAKARLQLKVAMAQTYNLAVKGQMAELTALDPKLAKFWAGKLGELGSTVKKAGPVDATLANLVRVRDELKTTKSAWYPDFRTTFGHGLTMKVVPELATAAIDVPASSTRERELRALAFSKSYLMAKAGDAAGLRAIDEKLLYWWDEKLGGGLVPRVAVSLEGAPWVHDYAAMYARGEAARYGAENDAIDAKYARSNRSADYNAFTRAIVKFTSSSYEKIRIAGQSVLAGRPAAELGREAKALIEAVHDAPATAPQLFRRESWESVARRAGSTRQGLEAFFRAKVGTDYTFQMDLVSTQYAGSWQGDLKWVIDPGAKAVFAQPWSTHKSENEYITAGRFRIKRVEQSGGMLVVHVKQVGTFDLPD